MSTPSYLLTDAITRVELMADDPNHRHDSKYFDSALDSASKIDSFLSRFNHDNNYCDGNTKLHVGDTIYIGDGTYNCNWAIVGFDLEHNITAADGTVYDNGYGIMLWLINFNIKGYWNEENTTAGGYMNSLARSTANTVATNMKNNILGTHIVNRNTLLSNSINAKGSANGYAWTTDYGTIPSVGQLEGFYYSAYTRYDEGEANYVLPYVVYKPFYKTARYWTRNICMKYNSDDYCVYHTSSNTRAFETHATTYSSYYYLPLIYIR